MNDTISYYILRKGDDLFVEFTGDEQNPCKITKSIDEAWRDPSQENLEMMLAEYEERLKGFNIFKATVETQIVVTYEQI